MRSVADIPAVAAELGRVLVSMPRVEVGRRLWGPKALVRKLRRNGERARGRGPAARARLRGVIAWVDARLPGGPNCYRRTLLEIALDRGAAAEPVTLGLKAREGAASGHAWLGAERESSERYDVEVIL